MEFSLAPLTLHRPHPLEAIAAAGEAGYDLTGIQLALYGQPLSPLAREPEFLEAARRALTAAGLPVLEVSNVVLDEDFSLDDAAAIVAFAEGVGARFVQSVSWDPERGRAAAHLAAVAGLAAERGLTVAFEFMPYSATRSLAEALALLEDSGAPNVVLLLDSLHFFRSGGAVAELAAVPAARLGILQLSDARAEAPPFDALRAESTADRLVPGDGELPLAEMVEALPDGLPVSLEVPCRALEGLALADQARAVLEGSRRFFASVAADS
ncbi:MAG TPA: TIM barrel protein [Acidimicrobiales bacterium]|nr:TIM barrel protein [Acidimicrobiales bacterium]